MVDGYDKPLPIPTPESRPYWDAARAHRLALQRCGDCGRHWHPPSTVCPGCGSREHDWVDSSGKGKVFSFVTYHRLYNKGWKDDLPYVVAVIELEEGARLLSNVIGIEPDDVACDMAVEVVFDDVTGEVTLPRFRPVGV
ncbi:MAG: Zn-ribbon domain-containing OB-fold protein [Alphaproteobacteria bacterium]